MGNVFAEQWEGNFANHLSEKDKKSIYLFDEMAYSPDQPGMNVAIMKQNLTWFSHYILGESMKDTRVL